MIELMVVVILLGLIGSIAVSSWVSMLPNQQFNSAVRNLSEVLYGTRSDAIARNREFRIYYDLDNDKYWVRTPFKPGGGFASSDEEEHMLTHETDLAKSGIDVTQITIDDVAYQDGVVFVAFQPLGSSSHHTIVLHQTQFERDFTLEQLPLTGDVRMTDGYFKRDPAQEGDFK